MNEEYSDIVIANSSPRQGGVKQDSVFSKIVTKLIEK